MAGLLRWRLGPVRTAHERVDLPGRLERYDVGRQHGLGVDIDLVRIALVEDDCTAELPSFEAETKRSDPRFRWFTKGCGAKCWELDALDPRELRRRVEQAIVAEIDPEPWERCKVVEAAEHASLVEIMRSWRSISRQASEYGGGL